MFRHILLICVVLMLGGCGGGGADIQSTTLTTTMGQELMDLDNSYKQGIITETEYDKAKKSIMKRYNN